MVKSKKCRCGKSLVGCRKLCHSCRVEETEYRKILRKVNENIDNEMCLC